MTNFIGAIPFISYLYSLFGESTAPSANVAAESSPEVTQPETTDSLAKGPLAQAKRRCELLSGKPWIVRTCFDNAKRWIEHYRAHPEELPKPKTPLEQEMARCDTIGKTAVMMACKRGAPARLEARRKAAEEAAKDTRTPLQKALQRCSIHSKSVQVFQCQREARAQYGAGK